MIFRKVLALRGPNIWARFPVLEACIDLGKWNDSSSEEVPGLNDRLMSWLPTMIEHRCSEGVRGGFFERLRRGTYPAHILEHLAIELQNLAGTEVGYGKTRAANETGVYYVAVEYEEEELARACLETARLLLLAALQDLSFDVAAEVAKLRELAHDVCLGPSTKAIVAAARKRNIPYRRMTKDSLVQLGHGSAQRRICTAETDQTSAIAEAIAQDKELTRSLLQAVGVPVPKGRYVTDAADAWRAAQEIGGAVVVKPRYGNHGRGVATDLTTHEQVLAGYEAAIKEGSQIIVERFAPGVDYRVLVIGGKVVAAALRESAHVIGDGASTINQLVEETNRDPRRSDGHATSLSYICINEIALSVLAEQQFTPESVPAAGVKVIIRRNANLSTGGTATDVTDLMHPDVVARCEEAASVIGLDIAGVDVVALDISRPLEEQGGVIVEVNAGPGLRMHLEPSSGKPRPVGEAIVEMLFPAGATGRIPTVAVTGTNGKTTTARLMTHLLQQTGKKVGLTTTDGIYVANRRIDDADCAGPASARGVLMNPQVQAAVLETARGGILRAGLGFDQCDVAIVTNIAEGDHLGLGAIETPEDLAKVKRCVVEVVAKNGAAVLNAADPLTAAMASKCPGSVIFFAQDELHPLMAGHRHAGGKVVFVRENAILVAEGEHEDVLLSLNHVPFTHGGVVGFQVENCLAAVAAAWNLGISLERIRVGLQSFTADSQQAPGRFNLLQAAGATVIVDYGHNTSALAALVSAIDRLPHDRRSIVYTVAGDRRDIDITQQGEILGHTFDEVIVYEDQCTRGRKDGDVIRLLREGLAKGTRVTCVQETRGELKAIELGLQNLRPGDLVLVQADSVYQTVAFVNNYLRLNFPPREGNMSVEVSNEMIEVREGPWGRSVYAARLIEKGEFILGGWGFQVPQRSRHSFQVDHDTHIVIRTPIELINHSCEPNCGVLVKREEQVLEIHALRDIQPGEELFSDYAMFEYHIQFLGDCLCGSAHCRGQITGFKDLPNDVRDAYGPYIAEYLVEMDAAVRVG